MKIYMIRHGETDWNKKRKLDGTARPGGQGGSDCSR